MKKNPYNNGNYALIFAFIQGEKSFTMAQVIEFAMGLETVVVARTQDHYPDNNIGDTVNLVESMAKASSQVVCCPRETGDGIAMGRGNYSSMGHLYFLQPLKRKTIKDADGNKTLETQRYRLRWRKEPMAPWTREYRHLTYEQQVAKEAEKAEAKAIREAEAKEAEKAKAERAKERELKRKAKAKADAEKAKKREALKAQKLKEAEEAEAKPKTKAKRKPKSATPKTPKKATAKKATPKKARKKASPKAKVAPAETQETEVEIANETEAVNATETATETTENDGVLAEA